MVKNTIRKGVWKNSFCDFERISAHFINKTGQKSEIEKLRLTIGRQWNIMPGILAETNEGALI